MELLLLPLKVLSFIFILAPYLAAVPALIFLWYFIAHRRWIALAAALLWAAYGVYETAMMLRILCTGECNIRVDLLLIYPLLIAVSIAAAASYWRNRKRPKSTSRPQ